MICYRDMTFCSMSKDCKNQDCYRRFTDEMDKDAQKWWGGEGYPLCVSNMKDTEYCPGFIPNEGVKNES